MNSSFKPLPPETVQNPASPVDTQTRSRRRRAALRSLCNLPFLLPPLGVRAGLRVTLVDAVIVAVVVGVVVVASCCVAAAVLGLFIGLQRWVHQ